ncbi:MAG TPA: alkaline phosphatase family protein, partial [Verrucomicrobiae bacterium]|nr:alkaline phosphatase family protein [Verrucomicrobiae bacterium]
MRRLILPLTLLGLSFCAAAAPDNRRPSLVVLIAVDGLGADVFDRYAPFYTGGFHRLKAEGMSFTRAMVDHAVSVSHPGHVTLATGLNPSRHGIVDAAFYERDGAAWRFTDAVRDPAEKIVGDPNGEGASPKKFLATTLAEWVIADPEARFVAVGSGRFSSLLQAGRPKGDVYWYSHDTGRYVTSTYYRSDVADWVARFNAERLPGLMDAADTWENSAPPAARSLARRDDAPYEYDGTHVAFPHNFRHRDPNDRAADRAALAGYFGATPGVDGATLKLAVEAVDARRLGRRGATDYLGIVVSQVDDIGHSFGPGSQEHLDNLLRLDRALGEFFMALDAKVGKDRWVVALSADHGMLDIPESLAEVGKPGRRLSAAEIGSALKDVRETIAASKGSREEIAARVVATLKKCEFVADAYTPTRLLGDGPADPFVALWRHSYSADRVPRLPLFDFSSGTSPIGEAGVAVRLTERTIIDLDRAIHGSPYDVDRHVPLIFMGAGVAAGSSGATARTVDVAPTLARLAGVKAPEGLDGRA